MQFKTCNEIRSSLRDVAYDETVFLIETLVLDNIIVDLCPKQSRKAKPMYNKTYQNDSSCKILNVRF